MTLELFRPEARMYRRTSLVDVPSGTALADLRIPADRRGWVVVAHDASSDPASTIEELNRSGLATLCVRFGGAASARFLAETVAWLKRGVAEAQGLPVGLLGFGAAGSAALEAAAVLGTSLGALVTVNAAPDLAKARLNGVRTFTLLIADEEHLGVNRRAVQRVRGVARLERADGSLEGAARVYGAAWLSGHVGATGKAAPARGMLSRLVGSWRTPKLWLGAPSKAAAAFLLAAGAYFASAPSAEAAIFSDVDASGVLTVEGDGVETFIFITDSGGSVKVNGADPGSGVCPSNFISAMHITGSGIGESFSVASVSSAAFTSLTEIIIDGGAGNDSIIGSNDFGESLIGGLGADSLFPQDGNDTIVAGSGDGDAIGTGNGNNLVVVEGGTNIASCAGGAGNDTLRFEGTVGNDNIQVTNFGGGFEQIELLGLGGDDTLTSSASAGATVLLIDGGEGNDSIVGPSTGTFGAISLLGGGGNDTVAASGFGGTLVGGLGDDSLVGGLSNDLFQDGGPGSTTVFGGGGGGDSLTVNADSLGDLIVLDIQGINFSTISGGIGNDTINLANVDVNAGLLRIQVNGGDGNDSLEVGGVTGASLAISLFGGDGNDTISGSALGDTISGDGGDDSLLGNDGSDRIFGDVAFSTIAGSDTIIGGEGNDTLIGDNDSLVGGNDLLDGGNGDDSIEGNLGNDEILGGDGNDTLMGNEAREDGSENTTLDADTIDGGDGNDSIFGGFRNDFLDGGDGNDTLAGGRDNDTVLGGAGDDFLTEVDTITSGNDSLEGGTGNDLFMLKPGSDDIVGDSGGTDTLNFSSASLGVRMNLDKKGERQSIDTADNGLTLFGVFEGWVGSAHDDHLELSPLVSPRFVDGGGQDSIDTLTYDAKGFGVIDNDTAGTLTPTSGGFGVVTYLNWELVETIDSFDSGDIDGDSIPNDIDTDDDNDGIKDDKDPDRDGDGWDNDVEEELGTDPDDPTDFPPDSLVGSNSGVDTDGDGIPNEVEDVTGDLDLGVAPGPLSVSKFKGKLKFPVPLAKDSLSFKARLAMPLGFAIDGAHVVVDIGGVIKEFDLDKRGNSSRLVKNDKAKMKLLSAKKQIQDGALLADLTVTLKKQDFSPDLADEGLDDTASDLPTEHVVPLFVIVESSPFKAVKKVIYKNKSGFSGSFKNTKVTKPAP